ncbi:MAG TPA: helix-turn-helix transcriptional regulator [Candidatus Goldiibacteriota bacterium]|nr:helix-turn-helix transcriptional regulator [Candidatus Goldiibacteriota bacterium]
MKKTNKAVKDKKAYKKMFDAYMKDDEIRKDYENEWLLNEFARELQAEREKKNISQADLAKKTGMKQQEVSRIERGDQNAKVETLRKLADGVGKRLIVKLG